MASEVNMYSKHTTQTLGNLTFQSCQVHLTPKDSINESIVRIMNIIVIVAAGIKFRTAFLHV